MNRRGRRRCSRGARTGLICVEASGGLAAARATAGAGEQRLKAGIGDDAGQRSDGGADVNSKLQGPGRVGSFRGHGDRRSGAGRRCFFASDTRRSGEGKDVRRGKGDLERTDRTRRDVDVWAKERRGGTRVCREVDQDGRRRGERTDVDPPREYLARGVGVDCPREYVAGVVSPVAVVDVARRSATTTCLGGGPAVKNEREDGGWREGFRESPRSRVLTGE